MLTRLKLPPLLTTLSYKFTNYNVKQVRGEYLYILQDQRLQLEYMRQIQLQDGRKGIVLKIEQPYFTYVAMYQNIPDGQQQSFSIKNKKSTPWQQSITHIKSIITNKKNNNAIFDVNGKSIYTAQSPSQVIEQLSAKPNSKILSSSPILDICYDINYGDMYNFNGGLGSKKTQTLNQILKYHNQHQKHIGLYFNSTNYHQTVENIRQTGSWGFNNGNFNKQNPTGIGIYLLCVKVIQLGKQLSKEGYNVILGIDNYVNVLYSQWNMLQLLAKPLTSKSGSFIYNNAPKLPPISILNELYSNSMNYNPRKGKITKGSLTSLILTQNKTNQLMPEITPYTNNIKHLSSLVKKVINFPIQIQYNSNVRLQQLFKPNENGDSGSEDRKGREYYQRFIRIQINQYLKQKQQTQLKRKLYKTDLSQAPWDYYSMLDAEWWLQALKTNKKPLEQPNYTNLIKFIGMNIEEETTAHWKIPCLQAFNKFKTYLTQNNLQFTTKQVLDMFIDESKINGFYSPFKKDYLP